MVELVVDVNLFNMIFMQRSYAHRGKPYREDSDVLLMQAVLLFLVDLHSETPGSAGCAKV